jgi:hypothetical protein|tara:strand:- start:644 stop:907 length:264 start_codon:yes stop_codon:yes gene_type:complete
MPSKLPKWFDGLHYPEGETVTNPFSNEEFYLNRTELSMYDFIKGAEYIVNQDYTANTEGTRETMKDLRKGLDWFRKNNAKAYMTLLD